MKKWIACLLISISQFASANWQLDNASSKLHFVSTKKGTVAEVHTFKQLSGSIDSTGLVSLSIPLVGVNTNIPIRDERMQALLFESTQFPQLRLKGNVDIAALNVLAMGVPKQQTFSATVKLHGIEQTITAQVLVTRLNAQHLLVSSYAPVIIKAADFGLTAGVDKLREIAKLPSISYAVPVTFSFMFTQ